MQINKYSLLALLVAIFLLGIFGSKLVYRSDSQTNLTQTNPSLSTPLSPLPDERVTRLERAFDGLSTQIEILMNRQVKTDKLLKAALENVESEDPLLDEQEELTPEEQLVLFERARADQRTAFDERLNSRTTGDQPWVLEIESNLMTALETTLDPSFSGDSSVLCSDTLCRVNYRVPKNLDEDKKIDLDWTLAVNLGRLMQHSTRYSETNANGDVIYSYYMARNGYDFSGNPRATNSTVQKQD
jgi:hypothetical protein